MYQRTNINDLTLDVLDLMKKDIERDNEEKISTIKDFLIPPSPDKWMKVTGAWLSTKDDLYSKLYVEIGHKYDKYSPLKKPGDDYFAIPYIPDGYAKIAIDEEGELDKVREPGDLQSWSIPKNTLSDFNMDLQQGIVINKEYDEDESGLVDTKTKNNASRPFISEGVDVTVIKTTDKFDIRSNGDNELRSGVGVKFNGRCVGTYIRYR